MNGKGKKIGISVCVMIISFFGFLVFGGWFLENGEQEYSTHKIDFYAPSEAKIVPGIRVEGEIVEKDLEDLKPEMEKKETVVTYAVSPRPLKARFDYLVLAKKGVYHHASEEKEIFPQQKGRWGIPISDIREVSRKGSLLTIHPRPSRIWQIALVFVTFFFEALAVTSFIFVLVQVRRAIKEK